MKKGHFHRAAPAAALALATTVPAGSDASPSGDTFLLGSWSSNSIQETRSGPTGCDNGSFVIGVVLSIVEQSGSSFTGSGSVSDGSRFTIPSGLLGSSSLFDGTETSGSFVATLVSDDTLDVTYIGSEKSDPSCTFTGSGKLVRAAGVDPLNEAGTQTTGQQRVQDAVRNYLGPLGNHLQMTMRGKSGTGAVGVQGGLLLQTGPGMAAGEGERMPFGVWGSYSRASSDNSFTLTEWKADHNVFLGGIDFIPNDRVVAGLALGYESTDTTTTFNAGKQKYDAFTIGPYIGAIVNDWLSLDFTAVWSATWFDQWRTNSATGAQVTSEPDGSRTLIAGNLNVNKAVDDFLFTGHGGIVWAQDAVDEFTESDGTFVARNTSKLAQVRIGAEVAYAAGRFEPYFGGTFEYDYSTAGLSVSPGLPQPTDDDTGFYMNLGVRYYHGDFSGSLEYNKILGRTDYDMDTFMIMLRGEF